MKTVLKALLLSLSFVSPLAANPSCDVPCCGTRVQGPTPCCSSMEGGLYFSADFLWWKACLTGNDYGISVNNSNLGSNGVAANAKYLNMHHDWAPAFRLQAGLLDGWCGIDFLFSYTYYRDVNTLYDATPVNGLLYSTLLGNVGPSIITTNLTTEHNLRYQTIDFLFGKEIYSCGCHSLMPFIGIQGLKLDQDWLQNLSGFPDEGGATGLTNSFARLDSTVEALGLQFGSVWNWKPAECFAFFSKAAVSVLAGKQDGTHHQVLTDAGVSLNSNFTRHYHSCDCIPGIQLSFGASYITECMDRKMILSIGYEFNEWLNVSQIGRYPGTGSDLALSLESTNSGRALFQGLFVRFGFEL